MDPLIVVAEGRARAGKEDDLRGRLQALLAPTRAEQGCIQYDMHESVDQPGLFVFLERWTNTEALDRHLQEPHLKEFFGVMDDLVDGGISIRRFRQVG